MLFSKIRSFPKINFLHPQWLILRHDNFNIIDSQKIKSGDVVVDVGSGKGGLKSKFPSGVNYHSLDYPATCDELYSTKPETYGNAEALPYSDGVVDHIICFEVIEHVKNPDRVIQEIGRVLKKEGSLFLSAPFAYPIHDAPFDYQRLTRFQIKNYCDSAGLQIVSVKEKGSSFEAALLLLNVSLAKTILAAIKNKHPSIALILFAPFIPFMNLIGRFLGVLSGRQGKKFLPLGYQFVITKHS